MANIFDVSKYILTSIGEMSTMKLQKLCYYSQAWTLVWDKKPLFGEEFKRWDNGPVCRELFDIHQKMFNINAEHIPDSKLSEESLTNNEKLNVDTVLEHYGKYSGAQLSELSHSERPWSETPKDAVISVDCLKLYYSSLIQG